MGKMRYDKRGYGSSRKGMCDMANDIEMFLVGPGDDEDDDLNDEGAEVYEDDSDDEEDFDDLDEDDEDDEDETDDEVDHFYDGEGKLAIDTFEDDED